MRSELGRVRAVLPERGRGEAVPRGVGQSLRFGRRRYTADAALRRRDLGPRSGTTPGVKRATPRRDGVLPLAFDQDRKGLPAADRGRVGIRLPGGNDDRLL